MWDMAYRVCTATLEEESSEGRGMAGCGAAPSKPRYGAEPCQACLVLAVSSRESAPGDLGGNPGDKWKLYMAVLH